MEARCGDITDLVDKVRVSCTRRKCHRESREDMGGGLLHVGSLLVFNAREVAFEAVGEMEGKSEQRLPRLMS